MTFELAAGLALALMAAVLQGTFLLPMASARNWRWEHNWAVFSLFAMLLFNWAIAIALLPNLIPVYRSVPVRELLMVMLFGAAWGAGAVLFGLAVDKLGLALGYPIIMGLNASLGAVIPLVFLVRRDASAAKVMTIVAGTAIALGGIVVCSVAGSRKENLPSAQPAGRTAFTAGLMIAVASGILCGLPNVGMVYAVNIVKAAKRAGAPDALAGNAVWALFFTLGAIVNVGYCVWLMVRRRNIRELFGPDGVRNLALGSLTALMWIGSFYLYGIGAPLFGNWGAVIGWPVFISVAIGVGCLAGLWKGEWKRAPASALGLLRNGLLLILAAVITLAAANAL